MTRSRLMGAVLPGLLMLTSCAHVQTQEPTGTAVTTLMIAREGRLIPVMLYQEQARERRKLAVVAAGYGLGPENYTFISAELVRRGYVVAALPSHLASDQRIPSGPDVATLRRPFWENGVADIRQVIATLRKRSVANSDPVLVVGHSHGGDIAMLLAQRHPGEVRQVFSLDNRRVAIPRTDAPRICSVRSSDQIADPGVLPDTQEQRRYRMLIVQLADQRHDDMWDGATAEQKAAMIRALDDCLDRDR